MLAYIICGVICLFIWVASLVPAIKERLASEIYGHIGMALFFTLLVLGWGIPQLWDIFPDILWIEIIGFIFFIPAAFLVGSSFYYLYRRGGARRLLPSEKMTLVDSGIYGVVRHPMLLGLAVWSLAMILVFQSALAIVLGIPAIVLSWMAAREEDKVNQKKFGASYKKYMARVPRWNAFKGLMGLRKG
jgi:protein-S-isoprenylcysteine O-methyltransferase Ste14